MTTNGSGLGLSVVYGVIKDHNSYYDVFSEVDKGTEFVIYFPIVKDAKPIKELIEKIDYRGTESLLIVDDNNEQREVGTLLLSDLGYKINSVTNGRDAVEYIKNNSVDLVLLAMIMEDDFDGYDTYCEIIKFKPEQKIIIVSGYSATSKVIEMQKMGAGPYIKKPYTRDKVAGTIRQCLDKTTTINSPIQ